MTEDKWKDILGMIKDSFGIDEEYHEEIEDVPNSDIHVVVFNGPVGKTKLEFETKPIVEDRKTIYSKLAGAAQAVEYVYSDDEFSHKLTAFVEKNGDWIEMDAGAFS